MTTEDPRLTEATFAEPSEITKRWNERFGSLDRAPYPESLLSMDEERVLVLAFDSLAARLERAERGRVKSESQARECMRTANEALAARDRFSAALHEIRQAWLMSEDQHAIEVVGKLAETARVALAGEGLRTCADDVVEFENGYRASARLSYHDRFARCPDCGNATVGYSQPWAINHAPDCKAALTLPRGSL